MRIVKIEPRAGHFDITLEIPNAYTDGASRYEVVPLNLSVLVAALPVGQDLPTKAELLAILRRIVRLQRFLENQIGEEI